VVPLGRDIPDNDRVYPELVEGMRFRVRLKREIRRVRHESVMGFQGKSVLKIRTVFELAVLTKDKIFHFPS